MVAEEKFEKALSFLHQAFKNLLIIRQAFLEKLVKASF